MSVVRCVTAILDGSDLDCGIRPEMVAVLSVNFREPTPNSSPDLTDKVEAALLSQMSEIADQVCDGMLLSGAAVLLESRNGLGGPGQCGHVAVFASIATRFGVLPCHGGYLSNGRRSSNLSNRCQI